MGWEESEEQEQQQREQVSRMSHSYHAAQDGVFALAERRCASSNEQAEQLPPASPQQDEESYARRVHVHPAVVNECSSERSAHTSALWSLAGVDPATAALLRQQQSSLRSASMLRLQHALRDAAAAHQPVNWNYLLRAAQTEADGVDHTCSTDLTSAKSEKSPSWPPVSGSHVVPLALTWHSTPTCHDARRDDDAHAHDSEALVHSGVRGGDAAAAVHKRCRVNDPAPWSMNTIQQQQQQPQHGGEEENGYGQCGHAHDTSLVVGGGVSASCESETPAVRGKRMRYDAYIATCSNSVPNRREGERRVCHAGRVCDDVAADGRRSDAAMREAHHGVCGSSDEVGCASTPADGWGGVNAKGAGPATSGKRTRGDDGDLDEELGQMMSPFARQRRRLNE